MVATVRPKSETDLLLKMWERQRLTVPVAEAFLKLAFSEGELARVSELRAKNSAGTITTEELAEYDAFVRVSLMVSILHSRARIVLKATKPKAER